MVFGKLIERAGLTRAEAPLSKFIYQVGMQTPVPGVVGLPRLSRRRATAVLLLLALLVLLGIVLYKPAAASRSADYSRLPELFLRVAAHLNSSVAALESALAGKAPGVDKEGAQRVLYELREYREELEREDETGMVVSLRKAAEAYTRLANSSIAAYEAAEVLYGSRSSVKGFLEAVLRCDAAEMSSRGALVRENLSRAAELLGKAIAELAAVRPGDLPSEGHGRLVDEAAERLARAYRALRELLKAVEIAEKYPQDLEELCRAKRSGGSAQPSPGVASAIQGLNPGDAGPYSYHISRLKALLLGPGSHQDGCAGSSAGGVGGAGGGSGAGYQPPPSDD
jgi:hypothetical protein